VLQCVAVCCSVLQCVAVSILGDVTQFIRAGTHPQLCSVSQCGAVWCSVAQFVALFILGV